MRCEFIDALDMPDATVATMYASMAATSSSSITTTSWVNSMTWRPIPGEFEDLWDSAAHQELKLELLRRSFDATMLTLYRGPDRIGPM